MRISSWMVHELGRPMTPVDRDATPSDSQVLVEVAGCGVCHTDLGFFYDGVPTRHGFPLTLGHEISGTVVETGPAAAQWMGRSVVVPAVIPCAKCPACRDGHGSICPNQIFPGNDVHGGFASHVQVPSEGLCPVPDLSDPAHNPHGLDLWTLSVIADAVSTPYQAVQRSGMRDGDLAVFVGVGGVGGFGVQIASALGAHVVALDTDDAKLEALAPHGATLALRADRLDFKALKKRIVDFAKHLGIPTWRWKVFETSGTPAGQLTAYGLLGHGSYLSVVGFTRAKVELRLSNLMAFDATVEGNWGCLPEHYPSIVDLVLTGRISLSSFVERRPLSTINRTFEDIRSHRTGRRIVLVPEG